VDRVAERTQDAAERRLMPPGGRAGHLNDGDGVPGC
jgi:hypothetical protein